MRSQLFRMVCGILTVWVTAISATAAPQNAASAGLEVRSGASRPIPPDFLGFNGNLSNMKDPWDNGHFLNAMRSISPGSFRYPGGTIGNDWDWDTGWIDESPKVNPMGRHLRPLNNRYTLENLAKGQKAVGFTPVFMLNMVTKDLTNQIAALKRAQALGMPVRRVELGNEFYLQESHEPAAYNMFPTASAYAATATEWAAAIKRQFPGVKVAAIGAITGGEKNSSSRRDKWDELVAQNLKGVDALTIHTYPGVAAKLGADNDENSQWGTPQEQQKLWDALNSANGVARMLGEPAQNWHNVLANTRGLPRNMEFWITEFNMHDKIGPARYVWASGLYVSHMLHLFLADGRPALACYHNAAGPFAPYWDGSDELKRNLKASVGQDLSTQPGSLTAIGHAFQTWDWAMSGQTQATTLEFPGAPVITLSGRVPYPSLIGWTFSGKVRSKSILVNLSSQKLTVRTLKIAPIGTAFKQISAKPLKYIVNDQSLERQQGNLDAMLTLPAYSMTSIGPGQ